MPDIALRFHKDMLVLSAPLEAALARQGVDVARDMELVTLLETESVEDLLRMEAVAGAACVVAPTAGITAARLAHTGFQDRAAEVARAALDAVAVTEPQHVLVEIGPCGLPLDRASKASLNENRAQYAAAARLFEGRAFDAFFLNGFSDRDDMRCALMGVRQVSDAPVFASVDVAADGTLASGRGTLEEACAVMAEYGASAVGFATMADANTAARLAERASKAVDLPVLAQLVVRERNPKQGGPTAENPYFCADTMVEAAVLLRAAGAQFLRAVGDATPAYTGALAVSVLGRDVYRAAVGAQEGEAEAVSAVAGAKDLRAARDGEASASAAQGASTGAAASLDAPEIAELVASVRAEIADLLKGGA